jgi:predicted RNA-binding Zn-ribbon protein involved in translation (DUF1610 family)
MPEVRQELDPKTNAIKHPLCPTCGLQRLLTRMVLKPSGNQHVFECAVCDVGKSINAEN